jgi:putative transposase
LEVGPVAHGHLDQRWTLARVRAVVAEHFKLTYSIKCMALVLHRMGWSVQVPARRVDEREEEAVEHWRQKVWPRIKAPRVTWTPGSASKTRGTGRQAAQGAHLGQARTHPGDHRHRG